MILVMHMQNIKFYLTDVTQPKHPFEYYLLKFCDYKDDAELVDVKNDIEFFSLDLKILLKSLHHFADMYHKKITFIDFIFQESDTLHDIALLSSNLGRLVERIISYNITSIGEMI